MILVDRPRWPARGRLWSHLISDVGYAELHAFAEALQKFSPAPRGILKGVEPFVMPHHQHFLKAVADEGHVDVDFGSLSDTVKPPDALFEKFGIQRQVI